MFKGNVTFVGGAMRTGTSLLQSVLCGAPEANDMMYECIYLMEQLRFYANWAQKDERGLSDFFDGKTGLTAFTKRMVDDLLDQAHKQQLEPRHLILKNPEITRMFPMLMDLVPQARYVVAVRDPKDVVASMLEVARKQTELGRTGNMAESGRDMGKLTRLYFSFYNNLFRARARHDGRVHIVRYEDLILNYDAVIPRLAEFTGLDLSEHDPEADWKYTRARGTNKMFDTAARGKRMTKSNIGNYKSVLSTSEAEEVDKLSASFMKSFGYPVT